MNIQSEVALLCKAKYPILLIESFEERRILRNLAQVAADQQRDILTWTITDGLKKCKVFTDDYRMDCTESVGTTQGNPVGALQEIENLQQGALIILKDFHKYVEDPVVTRKLRDLHEGLKKSKKTVIMTTPQAVIPHDLQKSITLLDLPLPTAEELQAVIEGPLDALGRREHQDEKVAEFLPILKEQYKSRKDALIQAGLGLTVDEYENVIARCIAEHDLNVPTINREKKQIIKKSGILEYYESAENMDDIGGLANLKAWIRRARKRFSHEAELFGLERPRGILLVGPPGTGKSLTAKAVAQVLEYPLLRMDMSSIATKYYGETGQNLKHALSVADAIAPDVFWMDEVEKMFSGENAHEESQRSKGIILTHMEESTSPVFRIGTCNTPNLPPELMQRFEKVFFVDLPQEGERAEIFDIHLRQINKRRAAFDVDPIDLSKIDIAELARVSPNYVGREIRTIVKEALATAFDEETALTTDLITEEIKRITPMAKQKESEISALRKWAEANAIPASAHEQAPDNYGREVEL